MSGNLAVDTNAVIAYREAIPEVKDVLEESSLIILPAPVYGELLFGAYNSAKQAENIDAVETFRDLTTLIPITEETAALYARIRTELRRQGTPIPENDIWIAATCRQLSLPLVTNDAHFAKVPDLELIGW